MSQLRTSSIRIAWAAAAAVALGSVGPARAINIVPVFNFQASDSPNFDPFTGVTPPTGLERMFEFAEDFYQDAFEDNHTLTINYWYDNLSDNRLGLHTLVSQTGSRETAANIRIDTTTAGGTTRAWFIDPTPGDNSEFNMNQTLWRDLTSAQQSDWYNFGSGIPATFEAGFTGGAINGMGATNASDMLSVVLHEVGHALGMSSENDATVFETGDGDYDFLDEAAVFGRALAVETANDSGDDNLNIAHLENPNAMMSPIINFATRQLPSHTDLLAMAAAHNYTALDLPRREFYGGSNWNTATNWTGNTLPGTDDDVFIRDAQGSGTIITASLSGFAFARDVMISEGGNLSTGSNRLSASGDVTVTGNGSDIFTNVSGEVQADDLTLDDQAGVTMNGGTLDVINLTIDTGTELFGVFNNGTVDVFQRLINNGNITAAGGAVLTFISTGSAGTWDLGGTFGIGSLSAEDGDLIFDSGGMFGAFDGDLTVGPGHVFRFDSSWFNGGGRLTLNGGTTTADRALIDGGVMTANGSGTSPGRITASGQAHFDNQVNLHPAIRVDLAADANLEFNGTTSIDGTNFTLRRGSLLEFDGNATLTGDIDFERINAGVGDARVNFGGTTTTFNDATLTQSGSSSVALDITQQGDALFLGDNVINATRFDMDGGSGANTLTFGFDFAGQTAPGSLTLNVIGVDSSNNVFDGTLALAARDPDNRLTVNLGGLTSRWDMAGTTNLAGGQGLLAGIFLTRIDGSPMDISGTVNVGDGRSTIMASSSIQSSAQINLGDPDAHLGFGGSTLVASAATFSGTGTLTNLASGDMLLFSGVNLGLGQLTNFGDLTFFGIGSAGARHFTQGANGELDIKLGGPSLSQHDRISLIGSTFLNGTLDLSVVNGYDPALYDPHTIINGSNLGTQTGVFTTVLGVVLDLTTGLAVTYENKDVLVQRALLGDANLSGQVEQGDLDAVLQNWGSTASADGVSWVTGDLNGSGQVEQGDLDQVLQHWGALASPNFRGFVVPEPAVGACLALCVLLTRRLDTATDKTQAFSLRQGLDAGAVIRSISATS